MSCSLPTPGTHHSIKRNDIGPVMPARSCFQDVVSDKSEVQDGVCSVLLFGSQMGRKSRRWELTCTSDLCGRGDKKLATGNCCGGGSLRVVCMLQFFSLKNCIYFHQPGSSLTFKAK